MASLQTLAMLHAGVERFTVQKIIKQNPVLICEVQVLDEEDDSTPTVRSAT